MKFTIRDLLLVTVIVALAVGWWVDRSRLAEMHDREHSLRLESQAEAQTGKLAFGHGGFGEKGRLGCQPVPFMGASPKTAKKIRLPAASDAVRMTAGIE